MQRQSAYALFLHAKELSLDKYPAIPEPCLPPLPTLSLAANEPRAPALETVLPSSHKCMIHAPNTRPYRP